MMLTSNHTPDEWIVRRIQAEFLEMPGLRLTCRQAQRLFGVDERTCLSVFDRLLRERFLTRRGDQTYARLFEGAARRRPTFAGPAI